MRVGKLRITLSARPWRSTARFLLTRARALWPDCVAETAAGDQFGVHSSCIPDAFALCRYQDKDDHGKDAGRRLEADYAEVEVDLTDNYVEMTWSDPEGLALVRFLANDSVWGPDWDRTARCKATPAVLAALAS